MTISDEVLQRLVAQIESGIDVVIDAAPAEAQRLVTLVGRALTDGAGVIVAAAPAGELSLSSLIAQISGRPDFDGQDDSVLELGFKRLHVAGRRTMLVLDAPRGMSRSALRYVQHVSRHAAGLVLVMVAAPTLDVMLEEPVFAALRARLRAAPTFGAGLAVVPSTPPIAVVAVPARRRRLFWMVSAIGVAAAAVAWVGYGLTLASPAGNTRLQTSMPIAAAMTAPPEQARLALAEPAILPPSPPLATSDRTILARRVVPPPRSHSRTAQTRRHWQPRLPEEQEPGRYAWGQPYPEAPPWVTRHYLRFDPSRYPYDN